MKLHGLLLFAAVFICMSCVEKERSDNLLVGGVWVTKYNRDFGWWNRLAFEFINEDIVDTKHDLYFEVDTTKDIFDARRLVHFFGSKTKYKIERDSLYIYDPGERRWGERIKISKVTKDTLILISAKKGENVFTRKFYNIKDKGHFDKIVLCAGPCFGSCPVTDIIVDSKGDVFFRKYGRGKDDYRPKYFESHISTKKFEKIEKNFLCVDESRLKSYYDIGGTDSPTISTTLCSNHKIRKSVTDYGPCGPDELVWAYPELEYLYLNQKFEEIPNERMPLHAQLDLGWIEHGDEKVDLNKSERFLLSYYLMKGAVVPNQSVRPKYVMPYIRDFTLADPINQKSKILKVESDGRLFKFYEEKGNSYVVDIGFNFLGDNFQLFKEEKLWLDNFEENVY